jgi:hypothetical protein
VRALDIPQLNHRFAVTGGIREDECRELIQRFFQEKRRKEPGGAANADQA